ncbi:T9SS type A sorting domain-containing protein [bacterium]|nr:T9SS type A sorting domain-containing protein [bacterium]
MLGLTAGPGGLRAQSASPGYVPVALDPAGGQLRPAVIVDHQDRLLVSWFDSTAGLSRILLQGFDRQGGRLGPTVEGSIYPTTRKSHHDLAVDFNGQAVLAWADGIWPVSFIYFRRFDTNGGAVEQNPRPDAVARRIRGLNPSVGIDSSGIVYLVWQDQGTEGQDVYGARFLAADSLGYGAQDTLTHQWVGTHRLNDTPAGDQLDPVIAADRKGNTVAAWRDMQPDSVGIRVIAYDRLGHEMLQRLMLPEDSSQVTALSPPAVSASSFSSTYSWFVVSWVEVSGSGVPQLKLYSIRLQINRSPTRITEDSIPAVVDAGLELSLTKPALSGNENGDVALVWVRNQDGGGSAAWSFVCNVNEGVEGGRQGQITPQNMKALQPVDAIRQDGTFVSVWGDDAHDVSDLWMQNFSAGGLITDPMHISPSGGEGELAGAAALVGHPDLSYSLFWERQSVEEGAQIQQLTFSADDRPSGAVQPLQPETAVQRHPTVARAVSGQYAVGWQESGASGYRVRASLFGADGALKQAGLTLEQSAQNFLDGVSLSLGPDGVLSAAWERWTPLAGIPELVLAHWDSLGNRIGSVRSVASAAHGGGRYASLATSPAGNQMIVWREGAVSGTNARIRAQVFNSGGTPRGSELAVSEVQADYLGASGKPQVVASPLTGRFFVVWQEFFSDAQHLYYRLYSERGDSLELPQELGYRGVFGSLSTSGGVVGQTNPAVAVDSHGDHLVLWVEKEMGGETRLLGCKIDSTGAPRGSVFQVPGVRLAALPCLSILGTDRVVLAWNDTTGAATRLLAQSLQITFFALSGKLDLASDMSGSTSPAVVHIAGNVVDSVKVDTQGNFAFSTLTAGSYSLRVTREGRELSLSRSGFELAGSTGGTVDLGRVTVLGGGTGPELPRVATPVLNQNSPNPFNPSTTITFDLPEGAALQKVALRVYDLRGATVRVLVDEQLGGGRHSVQWDGRDAQGRQVASGVYFYRLEAGGRSAVRKMILLK